MITRRQSRLRSATSGTSNDNNNNNNNATNNNINKNISTKLVITSNIPDLGVHEESTMKCVPEMISDTDAQNISIPKDLFKDFENLKNATKLDSATLMRKLLSDFNNLKEGGPGVTINSVFENSSSNHGSGDVNMLFTNIKQECPSPEPEPEPESISTCHKRLSETLTVSPVEDLDVSRCKTIKTYQDQEAKMNFANSQILSPHSKTDRHENRLQLNNLVSVKSCDTESKSSVFIENNNENCADQPDKDGDYRYPGYHQPFNQPPYKQNIHYQYQYIDSNNTGSTPFVCKTEDLSSYSDQYGKDIARGSKLFKSRLKEELDRKDWRSNPDGGLRIGDNQLASTSAVTDNSEDTETYELPNTITRDFQSLVPVNSVDRLNIKNPDSENHFLTNIKASRYESLKDNDYCKTESGDRDKSPDNEIPLDLSVVKVEANNCYSTVSSSTNLPVNMARTSSSSLKAVTTPNPSFEPIPSVSRTNNYSNLYAQFEGQQQNRESYVNDFSVEDEKENFRTFPGMCSTPDAASTGLASEKPDVKSNFIHVRDSENSSPEITNIEPILPRIADTSRSLPETKSPEHSKISASLQQSSSSAVETPSVSISHQQETTKTNEVSSMPIPQINTGFLGHAGQNVTAKFIPLATSGNPSIPLPIATNVVALQKNDNCVYVYPMSFPTLTSMQPSGQQIGVPQPVMSLQKLEPIQPFVPEKVPEKDQLKLVAESNIFPGVYTSILKLSSHKRSRSKQDKTKSNPNLNPNPQTATLPPHPPPPPNPTAAVSLTTQVPTLTSQPMTSQAVMFIPTMRPLQSVCVPPTSTIGQSVQPQTNFTLANSLQSALSTSSSNINVPSKQTVTMTSAGVSNTHTSSSNSGQSIIMVYPHTAISAMGKPVRRRGRPPKLPMLTQLLVDKRPKIHSVPLAESKPEPLRIQDPKILPAISPLHFEEKMNAAKPEQISIDETEPVDDKMDGVEIVSETPGTMTKRDNTIKNLSSSPSSTFAPSLTATSNSTSNPGPLYQEMILSPRSLKNIKPRKSHSTNDFMKPNDNFICTSFRIRPRAFRSRRNANGRNRKNAKGSLPMIQNQTSGLMANANPQLQQQITQQQLQMHQQQLQKQLQQQIQQQQEQIRQREEEEKARKEQQRHQKALQQQQQLLQQQQQQHLQRLKQQQEEEEEEQRKQVSHHELEKADIHSSSSSPNKDMLKGSMSPLSHSASSSSFQNHVENNKSWGSDDNSRGSSPRNFFQELYHCKICNEIVSSEDKASHQRQHVPIRFFCQTCGLEYQSFLARNASGERDTLSDDDIPEDNNGEPIELPEPLQCNRCSDDFSHPKFALNRCLQVQGGNILCDLCGDQFRTFTNFYEHRNKVHGDCGLTQAEHYVCETCGKILYTSKALRLHRKLHLDRTVQCTINDCPRFFPNNMDLLRHIREQHDKTKEFSCIYDGCNKKFMKNFHLQEHIRVKHFNIRAFHCSWPGCTKEFAAERHLKVHLLIHKDEKPLKCEFCEYRCRQRNALNWHMRKHPEAPYKYRKFSINSSDC